LLNMNIHELYVGRGICFVGAYLAIVEFLIILQNSCCEDLLDVASVG